jgi:general secretion pathway protein K
VLLLVAMIAVMAATALEKLRLATSLSANAVALDRARGYAYAAETLATTRVTAQLSRATDRVTLAGGWSGRPFGMPVPGGTATARVVDGGNCFNVNALVARGPDGLMRVDPTTLDQLARLIRLLRIPRGEGIAPAIADWIDGDDVPLPGGAEARDYRGYRPPDAPIADVSELRAVKNVTAEAYRMLRPWLCALPVTDRAVLNINTLTPEQAPLLAMLLPDTLGIAGAEAALQRRPQAGYGTTDAFWNQLSTAGGVTSGIDVKGQTGVKTRWFALRIAVLTGNTELFESGLIDARSLPARLVSRQWGDAP